MFLTQLPTAPVGASFTFKGKFGDANQKQSFTVYYTDGTLFDFEFKKIKSLFYGACSAVAAPTSINAPICQITNIPISFNTVQWLTNFEIPPVCFGVITTYEYLLPSGWKLGATTSNGSTWLAGGNSVTVTSNLLSGGQIGVRPTNSCDITLSKNSTPSFININRGNIPTLQINGNSTLNLYCGDASAKTFTVQNVASCITSYEWVTANKGWYDAGGNTITANIITTIPSITIYPSCIASNPAKDITVIIKAGSEVLNSKVTITFSTAPPPLAISGAPEFCTSSNYSIPVSSACGASVAWSLEPLQNYPLPVTFSCTNCPTTTLTKYYGGTALLTATVNFPNCNLMGTYQKYIGLGIPVFRGWYNSPTNTIEPLVPWTRANLNATNPACYTTYITTSTDITANTTVVWSDGGNSGGVTWTQIGNNLRFYFSDLNQWAFFNVSINNSCGVTNLRYRFNSVGDNCTGIILLRVLATPNPSSNSVNVQLIEGDKIKVNKEIKGIKITDKVGGIKKIIEYGSGNKKVDVDISSLPVDIYNISVYDGTQWYTTRLLKN